MKLYIFKEEDRCSVAAVLVKNGYTVRQGKERKLNSSGKESKSYSYYVETVDEEEVDDEN